MRVEHIHNKNFIHRDIKPDNFCIGRENASNILLIDFGLAKRFRDPKTGKHIPIKENKSLTGTARYASLNAHSGVEQSRRDDIEGLGMVFIYLIKGSLPWQGLNGVTKEDRFQRIIDKKKATTPEMLCSGLPKQFLEYFLYSRKLGFEEKPDYDYLRKIFHDLYLELGYSTYTSGIDWGTSDDIESLPTISVTGINTNALSVTKIDKKDETSKGINFNAKSRNDVSILTDCTQKKAIIEEREKPKTLINQPYSDDIFKSKSLLDQKFHVSLPLLKLSTEDIPDERDCKVISHVPKVTDYIHHKPVGCLTLNEGIFNKSSIKKESKLVMST